MTISKGSKQNWKSVANKRVTFETYYTTQLS
jgi:hypothetical protein